MWSIRHFRSLRILDLGAAKGLYFPPAAASASNKSAAFSMNKSPCSSSSFSLASGCEGVVGGEGREGEGTGGAHTGFAPGCEGMVGGEETGRALLGGEGRGEVVGGEGRGGAASLPKLKQLCLSFCQVLLYGITV
jgi:hypothetical protein